jgi:hypothetical protein
MEGIMANEETIGYEKITDDLKAQIQGRYREISATYRESAANDGRAAQAAYEEAYWALSKTFNVAPDDLNWITAST